MSRLAPTDALPALPPLFEQHFIEGGWRRLERVYGCRTTLLLKWFELAGGLELLQQRRRDYQRALREQAKKGVTVPAYYRQGG